MKLKQLKELDSNSILLKWDDGHSGPIPLQLLRDSCPCAGCKGETVLLRSYVPPEPDRNTLGRYAIERVEPVGGYAIRMYWKDGHQMGLYTWELLRSLCQCEHCRSSAMK